MFDYSALSGRIREFYGTQGAFGKALGVSERTISLKMNGVICWKQTEIADACALLKIDEGQIAKYFFTAKV